MADQTVQSKFTAVGGREIQLGITRKPITASGGVAVFAAFCETIGLRGVLDQVLAGLGRTSPNALPASDHMLSFMVGVLTGASRFLHLERIRADQPLREMFGIRRFCAPSTHTRFFQGFTGQMREDVFSGLTRWALSLFPVWECGYTMDLDSTVLERFGEQEGLHDRCEVCEDHPFHRRQSRVAGSVAPAALLHVGEPAIAVLQGQVDIDLASLEAAPGTRSAMLGQALHSLELSSRMAPSVPLTGTAFSFRV